MIKETKATISLIQYNDTVCNRLESTNAAEVLDKIDPQYVNWVNVSHVADAEALNAVAEKFNLHHLLIEDVQNINHPPKSEEYDDCIFITLKMLNIDTKRDDIKQEQVSFVLGAHFLISFQEQEDDIFDPVRERVIQSKGRIRGRKADYLLYRLMDQIVGDYYNVSEFVGQKIDALENKIINNTVDRPIRRILQTKKRINRLKRLILPVREAMKKFVKEEVVQVESSSLDYFQDVYDHLNHVVENIESYREVIQSLFDIHASNESNSMNQVMKTLTVISTIFIPLTFLTGVYGMNFAYMPGLQNPDGFTIVMLASLAVPIAMLIYMRKKKWF